LQQSASMILAPADQIDMALASGVTIISYRRALRSGPRIDQPPRAPYRCNGRIDERAAAVRRRRWIATAACIFTCSPLKDLVFFFSY
jgi:hypothetical protein